MDHMKLVQTILTDQTDDKFDATVSNILVLQQQQQDCSNSLYKNAKHVSFRLSFNIHIYNSKFINDIKKKKTDTYIQQEQFCIYNIK